MDPADTIRRLAEAYALSLAEEQHERACRRAKHERCRRGRTPPDELFFDDVVRALEEDR